MPSSRLAGGFAALLAASSALVATAGTAHAACGPPQYCLPPYVVGVSRTASGAFSQAGADAISAMSADGRYVAFSSRSRLVPEDTNDLQDVYRRDLETNTVVRVSVRSEGGQADDWSIAPAISADGRYVAFTSNASNLTAPYVFKGAPHTKSVFRKDLVTGTVVKVNLRSDGSGGGSYLAPDILYDTQISMSADGRYVAFFSTQQGLSGADSPNPTEVYRKDLTTGALVRVSMLGNTFGNGSSWHPSLSADGRFVAFSSYASNFVTDTNGQADVLRKDLSTGAIVRVSVKQDGTQLGKNVYPSMSADGRYVSFTAYLGDASNEGSIVRKDLVSGELTTLTVQPDGTPSAGLQGRSSISADGSRVAFETSGAGIIPNDTNGAPDIYVRNLVSGAVTRVSRTSTAQQAPNGGAIPAISPNGAHVSFWSSGPLTSADDNNAWDVYRTNIPLTV